MSKRKLGSQRSCDDVKRTGYVGSNNTKLDFREVSEEDLERNGFVRNVKSKSVSDIVVELGAKDSALEYNSTMQLRKTASMQAMSFYSKEAEAKQNNKTLHAPQLASVPRQGSFSNGFPIGMPLYQNPQQPYPIQAAFNPYVTSYQVPAHASSITSQPLQSGIQTQAVQSKERTVNSSSGTNIKNVQGNPKANSVPYKSHPCSIMPPMQQQAQSCINNGSVISYGITGKPLTAPPATPNLFAQQKGGAQTRWTEYVTGRGASSSRMDNKSVAANDISRS